MFVVFAVKELRMVDPKQNQQKSSTRKMFIFPEDPDIPGGISSARMEEGQ